MIWVVHLWPPLAFLLVLAAASGVAMRRGATSAEAVGEYVEARVSLWLALTLALVGLTLVGVLAADAAVRTSLVEAAQTGSVAGIAGGIAAGAAMAGVYFGGLDRVVERLQATVGDYVPAGSTAVLGTGGAAFLVANLGLAPLVEEVWYRGVGYDLLMASLGPAGAVVVGCAAFGLFHWPGGAWYVLVTGGLVGGVCWALRVWDGGLAAPYAAHLTLNAIEAVVLIRRARAAQLE